MQLKIMADYECSPLWWAEGDPGRMGDIQPETLGLSAKLCTELWAWANAYDATFVLDDPASSGFQSEAAELAFYEQGRLLTKRVSEELGQAARVRYWRDP